MVKINCGIDVPKIGDVENFLKKNPVANATNPIGIPGLEMVKNPLVTIDSKVKEPVVLKAGDNYDGKSFDVQALGNNPIKITEITPENVQQLSKSIDIWYQGGKEKAEKMVAEGKPDPRFLHPKVGETMQYYGLEPINGDYVTHDPEIIEYARKNGLTAYNKDGVECFINMYNGDKSIIESTYTNKDGKFLSEIGGIKGTVEATQVKDMKVILLPVGSKVVPLESGNPKIIGVGDVICCAVKKGKAKNDWYVKPVSEFLKTAKPNAAKGNTDFITALENYSKFGCKDSAEWDRIVKRFS